MKKEKTIDEFIPTMFGWVSPTTPPINHNDVVVLCLLKDEKIYQEDIGYYDQFEWNLLNLSFDQHEKIKVVGWFPMPYNPDNF